MKEAFIEVAHEGGPTFAVVMVLAACGAVMDRRAKVLERRRRNAERAAELRQRLVNGW